MLCQVRSDHITYSFVTQTGCIIGDENFTTAIHNQSQNVVVSKCDHLATAPAAISVSV